MIVPTKGIHPRRALLTVGAQILLVLDGQMTISATWSALRQHREDIGDPAIGFDWFILALDLAYSLGAVTSEPDGIRRAVA
jgi:hypothetical protein